jgi:hypothetical protein
MYKTIIVSNLYWCEAWSLALREKHTKKIFENRSSRKIITHKSGNDG